MLGNIIIHGFLVGFVASMPVGAVAILSVQKTLNNGMLPGFVIGLAAAIVDLFYATIAVLGLGIISDFLFKHETTLAIVGSIFLIVSGIKIYKSDTIKQYRTRGNLSKANMANDFFSSILIAASNPVTIIGFGSFFASLGIHEMLHTSFQIFIFLAFIFVGAMSWWLLLSFIINKFRHKIKLKVLVIINRVTGLMVFFIGIAILIMLFFKH